ncbi:MAG: hypothetical protein WCF12_12030 [Propionicimonas sp.]
MNPRMKKIAVASAAGAGVVAVLAIGGGSLAFAESPTPSPSSSAGTPTASASGTPSAGHGGGRGGPSTDTPVTGAEADKVSAAVTAKDSAVTVTSVRKDPDGSYDALGTKAGASVRFDVSADLATITQTTRPAR